MNENEQTPVEKTDSTVVDPGTTKNAKEVSSEEVKPTNNSGENRETLSKLERQIENLNVALKQEREGSKQLVQELKNELQATKSTVDKFKSAFSEEKQIEPENTGGLTEEQLIAILDNRESTQLEKMKKLEKAKAIEAEVKTLEKEWDGTDGKPKYNDDEVYKWQESHNKFYLSPKEAFNEMNRDSIIDWEIKKRLSKKPEIKNVVTPGGGQTREPVQKEAPKNDSDIRNAVLEAIENASGDDNN